MAEAFVSALFGTILNNLDSLFREEIRLAVSLKTELESLQSTLTTIRAVLHDAEQKQWKSEAIRNWLGKLEQAAYDLEDVLEDFQSEALGRGSKVSTFFSLQNPLLFRSSMARRVKTAREKVDAIAAERSKFHLEAGVEEAVIERNSDRETSSLVDESEVFGRADEKGEMVSMILNNASLNDHDDLSVYAICGMGGLGKTTLAQLVYNDQNVAKAFDLRIWVCVSYDFHVKRLTKAILESIEGECDIQELDPLQRRLVEKLVGKRFLIVFDDVWNESHVKWDRLKQALRQSGGRGSAVIVTTRLEKVAVMMATVPIHHLGYLSDDDSWSLFKKKAFGMRTNEGNANLETIGRQIVQRCRGVPLAIKAIGSILHSKSQESEWLHVKDSKMWDLEDEILAVLRLSYEHLPSYMRQCFSFCSLFPKDYVMIKDELIGLWMANGFIPSREPLDLHDMGCEIFSELTRRSFFQEINEDVNGTVTCKMHDLIHDFARSIKGHECCVIESGERLKIPKTARHLFVHGCSCSSINIIDLSKLPPLRSLIFDRNSYFYCNISNPSNFIMNQKHQKVLDCTDNRFSKSASKSLKHLRYLRFLGLGVRGLPKSISSLHNLQTLNLKWDYDLQMLSKGLKKLKNLKYLDLRDCPDLISMPGGVGELRRLRKLSQFIVGKENGRGIDELKELDLEGELSITELRNVKNSTEAKNANLIKKQNLRSLGLSWDYREFSPDVHRNDEEILDALQPPSSLRKLRISAYQGVRFPKWMMNLLLPNLVEIELNSCPRCDQLPPLGKLRFLKVLTIGEMSSLKCIDNSFYGDMESCFPSLEVLKIDGSGCLEEWSTSTGGEHFPLLSSLTIIGCPKLVELPMLPSLKELVVVGGNVRLLNCLMMTATNLTSLKLEGPPESMDFPDGLLRNHKHLETLEIERISLKSSSDVLDNLCSLKHLSLRYCSQLESLEIQHLTSLSSLEILHCPTMLSLPQGVRRLTALQELRIEGCPQLERRCKREDRPNIAHIPNTFIS